MADDLDRVLISAAELRARASGWSYSDHGPRAESFKTELQDGGKSAPEGRRPDLQRYHPVKGVGVSDRQRCRDSLSYSSDGDVDDSSGLQKRGNPVVHGKADNAKVDVLYGDPSLCNADSKSVSKSACNSDSTKPSDPGHPDNTSASGLKKSSRRTRKPDREIYQPGGRRLQQPGAKPAESEKNTAGSTRQSVGKENRRGGKERELGLKNSLEKAGDGAAGQKVAIKDKEQQKQTPSKEAKTKNGVHHSSADPSSPTDQLTSKVEKLRLPESREEEGKCAGRKGDKEGSRRRKSEKEGKRNRAGGGEWEGFTQGGGVEQKDRGSRRNRRVEVDAVKEGKGRGRGGEQERRTAEEPNRSNGKTSGPSKRYSRSDKRLPRHRTYSSSSDGSSTDGLTRQTHHPALVWGARGGREFSSTDSLEEVNTNEEDQRKGVQQHGLGRQAGLTRRGVAAKGRNGEVGTSRGHSDSAHSGDDPKRKQDTASRGRGGGILILPTRTDLCAAPESLPRHTGGGGRGLGGLARGRGGRGGGTRRLWDPNNPEQKPALVPGQRGHAGMKHNLQQGSHGPLHFLDTDDEIVGSPPVHQGELFHGYINSQPTTAYYKFQNSDNPYYYQAPGGCLPYPYHIPYQMASTNGAYSSTSGTYYMSYGQSLTPEEAELHTRGELGKLLRLADGQEQQLSNLLSRDKLSPEGLERMRQLRLDLLALYERVLLTDIEFSDSQNLDQALWKNVFYQVIEHFRQLLKEPAGDAEPRIRAMLLSLLDEGVVFFDTLLQKLQAVFQFKLEDYMDGVAIRARPLRKTVKYALISAQRCMICLGDIARYREQASSSANYGKARSWYLKAQHIAPKNGRPYNQLALLAVYTKRKLDAVYYYMRSLAVSNPILTAKESLMSLFEETKRKVEQMEQRQLQQQEEEPERVSWGPRGPSGRRGDEPARVEIWVRPSVRQHSSTSRPGSESSRDSELGDQLAELSPSDLNKRFILSFLHAHGKLFTKVGMETFPVVAGRVLQEFQALLKHSPCPLGNSRMLQIITINMFAVHNAQSKEGELEARSALQEQATALGLSMFARLVQRCTELLLDMPIAPRVPDGEELPKEVEEEEDVGVVRVSDFAHDLRELLPSVKVWSDWMLGHPEQWNPPPCNLSLPVRCNVDVWQSLAGLCNALASVYHGEAPLYKADGDGDEELRLLVLEEDRLLAGFVPLLAAPQEPCYTEISTDMAIAADCKRVTVLKYFLEALCGQEEPLLAFKGGKYVSVATIPTPGLGTEAASRQGKQPDNQDDDVIVEAQSSASQTEDEEDYSGGEDGIRELRARRHALAHKLALQQKRQDRIQAVLQTCRQLELEIRPLFLVPDTNGFIDHLDGLRSLLACGIYILVVPLIVITELDGLARGQDTRGGGAEAVAHARGLQERAKAALDFLEHRFEARDQSLRAMTSRGNQLESIAFRSEDTSGQQGNNDDLILSCCLHYCKDKAKDFMPTQPDEPLRLRRDVVLLTDDRNLRVKALTRNVPVRDIPAFLKWAKVG